MAGLRGKQSSLGVKNPFPRWTAEDPRFLEDLGQAPVTKRPVGRLHLPLLPSTIRNQKIWITVIKILGQLPITPTSQIRACIPTSSLPIVCQTSLGLLIYNSVALPCPWTLAGLTCASDNLWAVEVEVWGTSTRALYAQSLFSPRTPRTLRLASAKPTNRSPIQVSANGRFFFSTGSVI